MTLLSTNSLQYKRRLVRDLNANHWFNGFYTPGTESNIRCNRARLKGGVIQCREIGGTWFLPKTEFFHNCYGQSIYASREV